MKTLEQYRQDLADELLVINELAKLVAAGQYDEPIATLVGITGRDRKFVWKAIKRAWEWGL